MGDKLMFVVLHLGKHGMEVTVERGGTRRRVNITWFRAESSDVPQEDWPAQVQGELDFQDSFPVVGRVG